MRIILIIILIYALIIYIFSYDFKASNADYLILIGAGSKDNNASVHTILRADRATLYLDKYRNCIAIVSGGICVNNSLSQASIMYDLLDERHIYLPRIILEDKSTSLIEQLSYSLKLCDKSKKIVICTSDYNGLRCKLLARKLGYKVNIVCARSLGIDQIIHIPMEEVLIIKDLFISKI